MAAPQAAKNDGAECGLKRYLWWRVYSSISTSAPSQNLEPAEKASVLKILSHGPSLR